MIFVGGAGAKEKLTRILSGNMNLVSGAPEEKPEKRDEPTVDDEAVRFLMSYSGFEKFLRVHRDRNRIHLCRSLSQDNANDTHEPSGEPRTSSNRDFLTAS